MNTASPQPAPTYLQIRERILHLDPADLGLAPTNASAQVWGVVVEMGYDAGTAMLLALADGTTSLHYSTGGGLVGRGDYAPIAQAAKSLVVEAQKHLWQMSLTQDFPLPQIGQVRFLLLAYKGIYAAEAPKMSLASGEHPLASLFQRSQESLGQMRLLAEKRRS